MSSKLSVQFLFLTRPDVMRDWILRTRPAVVKTLHHDAGFWREIKQEAPDVYLLGREYRKHQPLGSNPIDDAERMARHILDNTIQDVYDGWEGYNEKNTYHGMNLPRQCIFDKRLGQIMRANGYDYWAGSYGVGHPGVWLAAENRWLWDKPEFLDMLREPGVTGIAVHEYYAPRMDDPRNWDQQMPDTGWWMFRYRKWWPNLPSDCQKHIIITEYGIDSGAPHFDPGEQGGWRSFGSEWEYMEQLRWADNLLQQDDYVKAATLFCWGTHHDWGTFDVDGVMAQLLGDHIESQHGPDPEPDPVPGPDPGAVLLALRSTRGLLGVVSDALGADQIAVDGAIDEIEKMEGTLTGTPIPFWQYIKQSAERNDVDPFVIAGVIRVESNFNPDAVGDGGDALGLGQIHRATWGELMPRYEYKAWALDPQMAIEAIARYFSKYSDWLQHDYKISRSKYWVTYTTYNNGSGNVRARLNNMGFNTDHSNPATDVDLDRLWDEMPSIVRIHAQKMIDATEGFRRA